VAPQNPIEDGQQPVTPEAVNISGAAWMPPVEVTRPHAYRSHEISDGDLVMVGTARRGRLDEFTWAAIGGAVASGPSALRDLHDAYFVANPPGLALFSSFEVAIFLVFLTLTVTAFIQPRNRGKSTKELIDDIQHRRHDTYKVIHGGGY
jgi:hypothetical protein